MKKAWVLSYPLSSQRRLWSAWAVARLIWVFAGRTLTLLVLSCRCSIIALKLASENAFSWIILSSLTKMQDVFSPILSTEIVIKYAAKSLGISNIIKILCTKTILNRTFACVGELIHDFKLWNIAVFSEKTDVPHLPNQSIVAISVMKL